jgi:hypothetical protein
MFFDILPPACMGDVPKPPSGIRVTEILNILLAHTRSRMSLDGLESGYHRHSFLLFIPEIDKR